MRLIPFIILMLFTSCASNEVKYTQDTEYKNSGKANSPELLTMINDVPCRDMDGIVGLCSKRVTNNTDLLFSHPPLPYAYRFSFSCSDALKSDFTQDIIPNFPFTFKISSKKFKDLKSFICIGEIFPQDRKEAISAKYEVRVKVVDQDYVKREVALEINERNRKYISMGSNARWTLIYRDGKWESIKEKNMVQLEKNLKVMSESYMMRYNYYGL